MLDRIMRSEAHFAALLFAGLRNSELMRERFISVLTKYATCDVEEIKDVFVEPAPFRDGWKTLKEPARVSLINDILRELASNKTAGHFDWMFDAERKLRSLASWD